MHTFSNGLTIGSEIYYYLVNLYRNETDISESIASLTEAQIDSLIRAFWATRLDLSEASNTDYYKCPHCSQDQIHLSSIRMNQHRMAMACHCNSGCDFHGDVFVGRGRKYPRKVLDFLKKNVDTLTIG
jgi:predicted CopG family antitoxin